MTYSRNLMRNMETAIKKLNEALLSAGEKSKIRIRNLPDYRKQPKWFDKHLVSLKKTKCDRLNSFRITNNQYDLDRYLEAKLEFQQECTTKKDLYHKSVLDELCNEKDSVKFWTNIKYFLNTSCEHKPDIHIDEWFDHFNNLLNPTIEQSDELFNDHISNVINNSLECETSLIVISHSRKYLLRYQN